MSLSPCALSLLPLTISYIAGSEAEEAAEEAAEGKEAGGFESLKGGFIPSASFAAGGIAYVAPPLHDSRLAPWHFLFSFLFPCYGVHVPIL